MPFLPPRFRPALLRSVKGYDASRFARDLTAGLVVGVVAIPLAIAFAIASGVEPAAGLYTAIVAGILVSLLGGSRVQIAGPTGAFVVIVLGIVLDHGIDGLAIATMMAGVVLFLFGFFRLGQVIKFIPFPVITGFTAGIGAIIFLGQIKEVLGLEGIGPQEGTIETVRVIAENIGATNAYAVALALGTIVIVLAFRWLLPRVPGPVVALVAFTAAATFFGWPVETVSDRFGDLPRSLPRPGFPDVSFGRIRDLMPAALTIALLGAIESLLSAVVADGMIDDKHDSNQELMAQGIANVASPLFGGIPATGAIARTATNVQNGGRTPIAGVVHALVLVGFIFVFAPIAGAIPLAVLGGILVVVAVHMSDVPRFRRALRMPSQDSLVLLATFLITVLVDLIVAVEVGMVMAAFLFMMKMAAAGRVEVIDPQADVHYQKQQSLEGKDIPRDTAVYSIDGPFFFGAAETFQATLERVAGAPKVLILRMRHVPYMDATGLATLESVVKHFQRKGTTVVLSAVQHQPFDVMMRAGFLKVLGDANIKANIDAALQRARDVVEPAPAPGGAP